MPKHWFDFLSIHQKYYAVNKFQKQNSKLFLRYLHTNKKIKKPKDGNI